MNIMLHLIELIILFNKIKIEIFNTTLKMNFKSSEKLAIF